MSPTSPRLAILGAGHMAGAILRGIQQHPGAAQTIRVTTGSRQAAAQWDDPEIQCRSVEDDQAANRWAVEGADVVILGVKPAMIRDVLAEIAPALAPDAVVVSIAAGVTIASMEQVWPGAIIRTMPNTPAAVGKAVTGLAAGQAVTSEQRQAVVDLLGSVGVVVEVEESAINALSSISGSGPAFVYYFMECFLDAAAHHGFSPEQARVLVEGTFRGALDLLEHTGLSPATLREQVTSPKGSTQAALDVFRDADLAAIVQRASDAAVARARELGSS